MKEGVFCGVKYQIFPDGTIILGGKLSSIQLDNLRDTVKHDLSKRA